jgi:hypothetical protein
VVKIKGNLHEEHTMEFFRGDHRQRLEDLCRRWALPETLAMETWIRAAKEWRKYREGCSRDVEHYLDRLQAALVEGWKIVKAAGRKVKSPGGLLFWLTFEGRKQDGRSLLTASCNRAGDIPFAGIEPKIQNFRASCSAEEKARREHVDRSRRILRAAALRERVERSRKGRAASRAYAQAKEIETALGARLREP